MQPLEARRGLGSSLLCREPAEHRLAAKGCPGFVVEFNTYNISGDDHMSLTYLWQGAPHIDFNNYIR